MCGMFGFRNEKLSRFSTHDAVSFWLRRVTLSTIVSGRCIAASGRVLALVSPMLPLHLLPFHAFARAISPAGAISPLRLHVWKMCQLCKI